MVGRILVLASLCSAALAQQADSLRPAADSVFLRIVIPETDTVTTPLSRHRIAASTIAGASARVNGKSVKVYPTGGFAGLIDVSQDTVIVPITVSGPRGDTVSRTIVFLRTKPLQTTARDPVSIDSALMQPADDRWLMPGEALEVRFKGSPGFEASFSVEGMESGIPMRELPARDAGGFEGVYVGTHIIRDGDEASGSPVAFKLRESFWSSEHALARGTIRVLPASEPLVGELTGRRPFLNVGLGEDRLGGAKLGFLDPGVRLAVIGKAKNQYKVRLTPSMVAWVPEENVKLLPAGTPVPTSLVGSVSASGTGSEDIVIVGLTERLPYTTEQLVNPAMVVVNIFGATSNTNWITQHLSAEGIQNISWEQAGEGHYRLKIALAGSMHWGHDVGYRNGTNLQIRLRRPPVIAVDSLLRDLVIAVDAGHGGENLGAVGSTGARERDITLLVAQELQQVLTARGARVVMTRRDSSGASNLSRIETILASRAHILLSIHCNSVAFNVDAERVQGTATFYHHPGFKPLATRIYERLLELGLAQFGVVGSFNFALNSLTQLPNVLVETAFISNPDDEAKLLDGGFRREMVAKIVQGLEDFLKNHPSLPGSIPPR